MPAVALRATRRIADDEADLAIKVVLGLLRQHMGLDVVFVRQYFDGARRFRVVEALNHGPAAALATAKAGPDQPAGVLLDVPIVLRNGQVHGLLCCFSEQADAPGAERSRRLLQHGARLAARLLDNEQVLRQLAERSLNH